MTRTLTVGGRRSVPLWLALAATAVGLVLIAVAVAAQARAPQPPRSVGQIDSPAPSASAGSATDTAPSSVSAPKPLGASRPLSISIPSIGARSTIKPIGLARDGTLAVPQPGPDLDKAAWFDRSPPPGQPGPTIIEGHVDTPTGPSLLFKLGKLRPGAKIKVTRADGVVATFTVNAVRNYAKSRFPTETVYGAKDLSVPALRLITCSNFDSALRTHTGNAVVFAQLTSTRRG